MLEFSMVSNQNISGMSQKNKIASYSHLIITIYLFIYLSIIHISIYLSILFFY